MTRKIIYLFILFLLISCNEKYNYHPNKKIDTIISNFNNISKDKIKNVTIDFDYQVFVIVNSVWIRISSNNEKTFIDISIEGLNSELDLSKSYANIFITSIYPDIEDNTLDLIHNELSSNKYNNYNPYIFNELSLSLVKDKLDNKIYKQKISIEIPNNLVKEFSPKTK